MPGYGAGYSKYKYNGKEIQDDLIGGVALDWYDYGARFYDPQIGRWTTPDPHADRYYQWSPFIYVYNNPVNAIDPDGRDGVIIVFPDYKISTPVGKLGGLDMPVFCLLIMKQEMQGIMKLDDMMKQV